MTYRGWVLVAGLLVATAEAKPKSEPIEAAESAGSSAGSGSEAELADEAIEPVVDPLADIPHIKGPKRVNLGNNVELSLPEGMELLEQVEAQKLMRESGDSPEGVVATIFRGDEPWTIVIEYQGVGYVNDGDADELDADALLESIEAATVKQNAVRRSMKVSELFSDGWSEPPHYDRSLHHLLWGLKAHSADSKIINFNTRMLGRHGFLAVNLIVAPETLEASKVHVMTILGAIQFTPGSTYADHQEGDRDSGFGLGSLVLGGLGLGVASKAGGILLLLKKFGIFIVAGLAGLGKWLSNRKKRAVSPSPAPTPPPTTV